MILSRLSTRGGWGFPNLKSNSCELLPTFNNHQPTVIATAGQRRTPVATDGQRARVVLRRRNRSDGCGGRCDICISDTCQNNREEERSWAIWWLHSCEALVYGEERSKNLQKLTKNVKSCDLDQAFIEKYTRAQCTKVLCHSVCEHSIVCLKEPQGYSVWSVRRRLQFWFIVEVQEMLTKLPQHGLHSGVGMLSGNVDGYHDSRNV